MFGEGRNTEDSNSNGKIKSKTLKSTGKMKWTKLSATAATDDGDPEGDGDLLIDEEVAVKKGRCCSKNEGPSLVWSLLNTFKAPLLAAGFFKFTQDTLSFVGILLLK